MSTSAIHTAPEQHAHEGPHHLSDQGRRFLRRMTVATGGGMFLDGFVFASFAAAMAGRAHEELNVSATWDQWISASALIGTLVGGVVLGYVTDRIGRRPMFTIDMITFLTCGVLLFFVTDAWQVFALGLVLGLAVGADYSIGSPLLGEFAPAKTRGHYLGILEILWNVGYVVAYLLGYLVNTQWPGAWRIILGAVVVPALFCLLLRHGLPESPRWLTAKGRRPEAEAILRESLGTDDVSDLDGEQEGHAPVSRLFGADYRRRTLFACLFWSAIVLPYFGLTFFQPTILRALGLGDNALAGALLGVVIALLGAVTGWFLVDRIGRRKILIVPMFGCAVFLALAGLYEHLPSFIGAVCFFGYLFTYGVMSILPGVYPEEVFPSAIRATGVGVATAASRLAAAVGTFMLPTVKNAYGTSTVLYLLAGVSLLGAVMSYRWAPETNGRSLTQTSATTDPHARPTRRSRAARA